MWPCRPRQARGLALRQAQGVLRTPCVRAQLQSGRRSRSGGTAAGGASTLAMATCASRPAAGMPQVDHLRRHGCSLNRLAARAGIFAADVAQHEELGGHAVELLADLLADAPISLAAGAVRGTEVVVVIDARQVGGQCLAHGFALDTWRCGRRFVRLLGGRVFERGVAQDGVEQHGLGAGVQALGRRAEAPTLQTRDLEVQCLDPGLLELEFGLQALDQGLRHQHRIARGRGVEGGRVRGVEHGQSICLARAREKADIHQWTAVQVAPSDVRLIPP